MPRLSPWVWLGLAGLGSALTAMAEPRAFVSTRPAVRVEYWQRRLAEIAGQLQPGRDLASVRLVFLGDSITDFWTMAENPWFPGQQMGRAVWQESFAGNPARNIGLNLGISGDRTEHVLHRILPRAAGGLGELDAAELKPEFVVILIGVNNTWDAEKPVVESVVAGIRSVVTAVHERKPGARLILQSLLPLPDLEKNTAVIQPVNTQLQALAASSAFREFTDFLDLYPAFVDAAGRPISAYFADGVHPNEAGYRAWRTRLLARLDQLRRSRATATDTE
jgi:lysophospholipase L1-like esterase